MGRKCRNLILAAVAAGALAGCAARAPSMAPVSAQPHVAALYDHVRVLSADRMGGRAPGSVGERLTLDYLQGQWAAMGLSSGTLDPKSPWRQRFEIPSRDDPDRVIATHNLIGRIPGTEPQAGAVLLLAHWDHLGVCARKGDRICNGAIDNASGLAMITEIARILVDGLPLRRDIYILATGAEERGLLGAKAFAANPPIPLRRFVAAFNVDTEGLAPADAPVVILGDPDTDLAALIRDVAARKEVTLVDPAEANRMLGQRQDGWALQEAGMPAVTVSAAFADLDRLRAFFSSDYHRPADEIDRIELGAAAQMVDLHVAMIRAAADPSRLSDASAGNDADHEESGGGDFPAVTP